MTASVISLFERDPGAFAVVIFAMIGVAVVELLIISAALYAFYFILTLPMRRNERARIFLDLLQLGLRSGQIPEQVIVDAASARDRSVGVRFHLLASHIEKGLRLTEALQIVPRLLPPQLVSILKAGERIGDIGKVLPACRLQLRDAVSQTRGALNYLLILTFLITPSTIIVPMLLAIFIVPKYKEVFHGMMEGSALPAFTGFVFSHTAELLWIQAALLALIWTLMLGYIGGPRLRRWLRKTFGSGPDHVLFRLPWRRKRLQRDFSAMLSVLLDSSVPEPDAVALAAEAADNAVIRQRAAVVCVRLRNGVPLPEAIRAIDDSGELHWRLSNALRVHHGFLRTLNGWHEALDAKAFQLEQMAAQTATSALVLFNGFVVASIVLAIFLPLLHLIDLLVLW